jgi:hypothetical protein
MTRISEAELDHAFAEKLSADRDFQDFLLLGGRFVRFASSAHLLVEEQNEARAAKHWWKHWWCRLPDGTEWETDIFLVFEADGQRFALHIEDKPRDGKLRFEQAAAYRRRAAFKSNDAKWLNYTDFETILLAPASFLISNAEAAAQFDRTLSYEAIAEFVPLFSVTAG